MSKMKARNILTILILLGLTACSKKEYGIIINGKIAGNNPEKIEYTTPINGNWFYGHKEFTSTDSLGIFQIKMNIEEPSFATIYIPGKASCVLLLEPGKTYDIDLETDQNKFVVHSPDSIAQNFYNTLPAPDFNLFGLMEFSNDSIPSLISSKIAELKEREVSMFDELLQKNDISKDFYELAILDRKVYYSALEAGAATLLLNRFLDKKHIGKVKELRTFWDENIGISKTTQQGYDRSPWFYAFVNNAIWYHRYSSRKPDSEDMPLMEDFVEKLHYNIDAPKKYLEGKELEYYLASYIFFEIWSSKDNSKELIELYEDFKSEYPNGLYNGYLTSAIRPIIDYHEKLETAPTNEKVRLVKGQENIDTFDELIKLFHGKKVFIDIWGTWCAPCKREFEHKDALDKLLESRDIAKLYICEGRSSKKKAWKEMIRFYDLEGYHLMTNEKLNRDIIDRFGNNGRFAYPRYLLLDENGKVVNPETSYPSNIAQLEKEINESYQW